MKESRWGIDFRIGLYIAYCSVVKDESADEEETLPALVGQFYNIAQQ